MLRVEKTWLTVRVDADGIRAKVYASTVGDDGLTASESFEVDLGSEVNKTLMTILADNTDEANQRALEVGFSTARAARLERLEINGSVGGSGGTATREA